MKNKYFFLKGVYKNTLVIFIKDNKYKSFGIDNEILNHVKYPNLDHKKIKYILVNKDNEIIVKNNNYNKYYNYYLFIQIKSIISVIRVELNKYLL